MMLSNEFRPRRNSREMPRNSEAKSLSEPAGEINKSSYEPRSTCDWEMSGGVSTNCHSRVSVPRLFTLEKKCSSETPDESFDSHRDERKNISEGHIESAWKCERFSKNRLRCRECTDETCEDNFTNSSRTDGCKKIENVRWRRSTMRNQFFGDRFWYTLISFVLLAFVSVSGIYDDQAQRCAIGLDTPGVTWPSGDIVLEEGQPLEILCMLNMEYTREKFPGKNASDLVFFHNQKEQDKKYITIVNETTIAMRVENPPSAKDMYYCKLRLNEKEDVGVCLNNVAIGSKPQEPQNFTCVSLNWVKLICKWDPVPNNVTTKIDLVFKLPGRAGGRKLFGCPKDKPKNAPPNTCEWDTTTNPIYRQPYEYYTFIFNVTNVLGSLNKSIRFHHYGHVIPAKPANLSVVNKTLNAALLHWNVPFPMQNFPSGLHHRVMYQHQWDLRTTWRVINITNDIHADNRYFNLTGLEYANTKYDVRVSIKSAKATGEDKWSEFSNVTFRSLPQLPVVLPRTDIGSFEITENNANRDVHLYWQYIPRYHENGDNFKYQVTYVAENGRKVNLSPNETTRTYAKFKGISFNNYRFEIASTNDLGVSAGRATIFIPSRQEMPPEPLSFTKIAFDGGLYELSWKPPMNAEDITNYTIFWCDNDRDRPWACNGYLEWVHVSKAITLYNVTVSYPKKTYQFAISANTAKASSGMIWASCTVIHNMVVGKMKSVWINGIGSDYIEVGWKLECSDRVGVVEGFNVYYCPIVSPYNRNCKGPKLNTTIHANHAPIHGRVNGLKPYTIYMVAVAILTKNGEGAHSDPLFNTTLEASPSTPPLNIKINNITNSSMFVSWDPPTAMNGVLRFYEIRYNEEVKRVDEFHHVTLKNLMPYTNYSISVSACTVSCSNASTPIYGITSIGKPGKIGKTPHVAFINASQVMVTWDEPQNPGGLLDYYQIWSADGDIRNSTRTEANLPILDCETASREKRNQFRVRAVNVAVDGTHLAGPWSDTGEGNCYYGGPSFQMWIVICVIGSLAVLPCLFGLVYVSKKVWLKCKAMQDVEVKLPPGLASNMKLLHKDGEQHIRQSSADSSGCSCGQESVTSSLTSDSHVSSDSGAEIGQPANQPVNKLLETVPSWEASRLRQRNVGTTKPVEVASESPRWESYVKVAKTGEPILDDTLSLARSTPNLTDTTGGYAASPHAWSSTGYISMPSSEELSSNPSPVPKEASNHAIPGGYSVVGVAPKPVSRGKNEDRIDMTSNLINKPLESKGMIPYVSLSSVEQKAKSKPSDALRDFDDLDDFTFIESEPLEPITALESASSKPYVQTGLLDTAKKQQFAGLPSLEASKHSLGATTLVDSLAKKPFVSSFAGSRIAAKSSNPEAATSNKPYVAVGWMPDVQMPPMATSSMTSRTNEVPQQKSHPSTTGSSEASGTKPYVTAAAFNMLQKKSEESPKVQDTESEKKHLPTYSPWQEEKITDETTPSVDNKEKLPSNRSPSYVTIGENPKTEPQQMAKTMSTPPYVQHQVSDKQLPQQQRTNPSSATTATEERYSKVSVVPTTIQ